MSQFLVLQRSLAIEDIGDEILMLRLFENRQAALAEARQLSDEHSRRWAAYTERQESYREIENQVYRHEVRRSNDFDVGRVERIISELVGSPPESPGVIWTEVYVLHDDGAVEEIFDTISEPA